MFYKKNDRLNQFWLVCQYYNYGYIVPFLFDERTKLKRKKRIKLRSEEKNGAKKQQHQFQRQRQTKLIQIGESA